MFARNKVLCEEVKAFAKKIVYVKNVLLTKNSLLGAPGVGKGTYASRAAEHFKIPHIAAGKTYGVVINLLGDFIRDEIKNQTALGKTMKEYTTKGLLVPDQLVIDLLLAKIQERTSNGGGFLLDGFPRTLVQAEQFQKRQAIDMVVNLDQDEDIIISKITNRRVCSNCGHNYNLAHIKRGNIDMPPLLPKVDGICDTCGAKDSLVQRADDKLEVVKHRLDVYKQSTFPLVQYYENLGILKNFSVLGGVKQLLPSFLKLLKE